LIPVEDVPNVYIADVPYANLLEISEEQIIQEANPWAIFGFLTAMTYHGLTDLVSREVYVISTKREKHPERLPLGTMPDDWNDRFEMPLARQPKKVRERTVHWTQLTEDPGFGVEIGYSLGVPIYVTDVERTLLDAIRMPDKSGGIAKVLQAWRSAENINLDKLVTYTDRYDNQILRQRVGFMLEKLGMTHARLEGWRDGLRRGGSVKLVASSPYSATYSSEWNLSLNVPESVLTILEGN
jgi:predicted transcriptional regulator of viral defense system